MAGAQVQHPAGPFDVVLIGFDADDLGTVSIHPPTGELVVEGATANDTAIIEHLLATVREPGQSDLDLIHTLPKRWHSRLWATVLDTTDTTSPAYLPPTSLATPSA